MPVVVDTNVLVAANGRNCPQATLACRLTCIKKLHHIQNQEILVLDDAWHIIGEYTKKVSQSGQPGVGDSFLKWVLTNWRNPEKCQLVSITPIPNSDSFEQFPKNPDLEKFDKDDHRFVATALVHPDNPPIFNAVDSDWKQFGSALAAAGVTVVQLCPGTLKA
ncbi:MAG: hypothetical protein HC812_07755 [Leptolyngbya sp. RL_3_1]|nr:hypothetical protein [Leptolyngbya sp. RL_3_1]